MLRLETLVKQYKTGDLALKGIDLEVPKGQVMALIYIAGVFIPTGNVPYQYLPCSRSMRPSELCAQ